LSPDSYGMPGRRRFYLSGGSILHIDAERFESSGDPAPFERRLNAARA
jgi:hypothetical protein